MIHHRERLLSASNRAMTLFVSMPGLDNFQGKRDDELVLLSALKTDSAAALADLLQQLVMADPVSRFFPNRTSQSGFKWSILWRLFQKITDLIVAFAAVLDRSRIASSFAARTLQVRGAFPSGNRRASVKTSTSRLGEIIH